MKPTNYLCILLVGQGMSSHAATVLTTRDFSLRNAATDDQGNWHYQSATLNDPNFNVSGDPLPASPRLTSVSFIRDNGGSNNDLFLAVLTDPTDLATLVASSTNIVDVGSASEGSVLTWSFSEDVLSASTLYYFAFYQDDADGLFETDGSDSVSVGRITIAQNNVSQIGGELRGAPSGGISSIEDAYFSVTVIPEPSSSTLLAAAGLGLLIRRKR